MLPATENYCSRKGKKPVGKREKLAYRPKKTLDLALREKGRDTTWVLYRGDTGRGRRTVLAKEESQGKELTCLTRGSQRSQERKLSACRGHLYRWDVPPERGDSFPQKRDLLLKKGADSVLRSRTFRMEVDAAKGEPSAASKRKKKPQSDKSTREKKKNYYPFRKGNCGGVSSCQPGKKESRSGKAH